MGWFQPHYLVYLGLIAAGFAAGLFSFKYREARPVVILLGVTLCTEILSKVLSYTIKTNHPVYHFYHPIETILSAWFFYINLHSWVKRTVVPLTVILIAYAVVNNLLWQDLKTLPGNFIKFECVVILFWSFHLFIEFLDRPATERIFHNRIFIICVSIIWFNLVSYLFFDLYNHFVDNELSTDVIRKVHYFSNYTYYSLLLIAMLLKPQPTSHG